MSRTLACSLAALAAALLAAARPGQAAAPAEDASTPRRSAACHVVAAGHALCAVRAIVRRPGGAASAGHAGPAVDIEDTVRPQRRDELQGWVETEADTCTFVASGAWSVTRAPTLGQPTAGILDAPLSDGSCPGVSFPFAIIAYTRVSADETQPVDTFDATWSADDLSEASHFTLALARPPAGEDQAGAVDQASGDTRAPGKIATN